MTRANILTSPPPDFEEDLLDSRPGGAQVAERIALPASWVGFIPFVSWLVRALAPTTVVELGVRKGNSLFTFAEAASLFQVEATLLGVDTWTDKNRGGYAEDVFLDVSALANSTFPESVRLVRKSFDDAVHDFEDGSIDLLHINAAHTCEEARHDFETWRPKLSSRAVVLFRDIAGADGRFGVRRFWNELKASHPHFAFEHSNGLGVLLFGEKLAKDIAIHATPGNARDAFVELFRKLGDFLCEALQRGNGVDGLPVDALPAPPRIHLGMDGVFDEARAAHTTPVRGSATKALQCALAPIAAIDGCIVRIDVMSDIGIRAFQRITVTSDRSNAICLLEPGRRDVCERLSIIAVEQGYLFVGTDTDSHWFPDLSDEARAMFRDGARLTFEPMAAPVAAVVRMLIKAMSSLIPPRDARIERPSETTARVEADRPTFAATRDAQTTAGQEKRAALLAESDALMGLQSRDFAVDKALLAVLTAASSNRPHSDHTYRVFADSIKSLAAAADARTKRILDAVRDLVHANELAKGREIVRLRRLTEQKNDGLAARIEGINLYLDPAHGLVPLDVEGRQWHSVDDDPQFAFGELCRYAGQWVELTVGLAFHQEPSGSPFIYIDRGEGMSESDSLSLPRPAPDSGLSTIVFAVPSDIRHARFDPCAAAIEFTLTMFRIRKISRIEAMRTMARSMRHSGQLRNLRDTYAPQWRTMRSAAARRKMKNAFVDAYRLALNARSYAYSEWIVRFEPQSGTYPMLAAQRSQWDRQPTISVLMPTYDTPARFLREAIESVQRQEYPHWELCIADDASTAPHVRQLLAEFAANDARIKVCYRPSNGHISAASNSALELATGEFIALLDHDDRLHPLALHYVAEAIVQTPGVRMIYSDEDKMDTAGLRNAPYFKSDFNYELFLAQNMVSHLGCYATDAVRAMGGFRLGLEGSQDWDLGLRMFEQVGSAAIVHIPRVLYHWRETPGSTAVSVDEKPYAQLAGRRAVEEHVRRRSIDATVLPAPMLPSWNRIRYSIPTPVPKVSIVIPTRDKVDLLRTCVQSILERTTYENYEIVIVDNGSVEPDTATYLKSLTTKRIKVIRDDAPFNYSRLNNRAVAASSGELVCLLNNDIEVLTPDWLEEMVGIVSQESVGIVGARLWYPDHRLQHAGVILGIGGIASHSHRFARKGDPGYFGRAVLHQQLSAVTGACFVISRKLWDSLGGLDEELAVAFNDIDICLRAGVKGYRVIWTPYAELIHYESVSRGSEDTPEKVARFEAEQEFMRQRWGKLLRADPFYSPNLTSLAEDFSLNWESRI